MTTIQISQQVSQRDYRRFLALITEWTEGFVNKQCDEIYAPDMADDILMILGINKEN